MKSVALVGCGFLGSLFSVEMAKRAFAFKEELMVGAIDPKMVEGRNAANQLFDPGMADHNKAELISKVFGWYGLVAKWSPDKVTEDNINDLQPYDFIVCAVDNIPARQLLWKYAVGRDIPLLSMGISQGGTGSVEWTKLPFDNNSFSPMQLANVPEAKLKKMGEVKKLPPCELVGFRGLGLNVALAAAKSYWIYRGFDPELHVLGQIEGGPKGMITSWQATNTGHKLLGAA